MSNEPSREDDLGFNLPPEVLNVMRRRLEGDMIRDFLGEPEALIVDANLIPFPDFLKIATHSYELAMAVIREELPKDPVMCDERMKEIGGHVSHLLELFPEAKAYVPLAEDYFLPAKGGDIEMARKAKMKAKAAIHQLIQDRLENAIKAGIKQLDTGRQSNYFNGAMIKHGV